MKKTGPYFAIIGIAAFTGNMINIGLSYGIHWKSLGPAEFMESFAIDFPLLLYPTVVTLLPAFIATLIMYFATPKGSTAKRNWLYALPHRTADHQCSNCCLSFATEFKVYGSGN